MVLATERSSKKQYASEYVIYSMHAYITAGWLYLCVFCVHDLVFTFLILLCECCLRCKICTTCVVLNQLKASQKTVVLRLTPRLVMSWAHSLSCLSIPPLSSASQNSRQASHHPWEEGPICQQREGGNSLSWTTLSLSDYISHFKMLNTFVSSFFPGFLASKLSVECVNSHNFYQGVITK